MPVVATRGKVRPAEQDASRPHLRGVDAATLSHTSPAKELQDGLEAFFSDSTPDVGRWSGAVRMSIIVGGSVTLWAGLFTITKAGISLLAR